MQSEFISRFKAGQTVEDLRKSLDGQTIGSGTISVGVDRRSLPYLDHTVIQWVGGPPGSNVEVIFSGADPDGRHWRRFSLSRVGPHRYEIDVFPTPFNNAVDPVSPGIPPGASRPA